MEEESVKELLSNQGHAWIAFEDIAGDDDVCLSTSASRAAKLQLSKIANSKRNAFPDLWWLILSTAPKQTSAEWESSETALCVRLPV